MPAARRGGAAASRGWGTFRDAGESLGPLLSEVAEETGAIGVEVVLPGAHDTASAVAAVPAGDGTWAFLSSGTWSLLGIETLEPLMNERAKAFEAGQRGRCSRHDASAEEYFGPVARPAVQGDVGGARAFGTHTRS